MLLSLIEVVTHGTDILKRVLDSYTANSDGQTFFTISRPQ